MTGFSTADRERLEIMFTLRLTPTQHAELQRLASAAGVSAVELLRRALDEYAERRSDAATQRRRGAR